MNGPVSAAQIASECRRGALSPVSAVRDALRRLDRVEGRIDALVHRYSEQALERAALLAKNGPPAAGRGRLFGVPIAVKDNICVKDVPTTCGSRMLNGYRPPYHATVVERILSEGGIIVGMANMDEFAMGSTTETSAWKTTRNPWSPSLSPGGSSGGSAALVGSGALPLALGSDTGGSIRQPAALCGTVGFKPTYGTVSRYGLVAFGSSFDQIGPLLATVRDGALLFEAIGGFDRRDSTSIPDFAPDAVAGIEDGIDKIRIGVPGELMGDGIDGAIIDAVRSSLGRIEELGASIVSIDLPHAEYAIPAYYVAAMSEASSNLARFDGVRYGLREEGGDMAGTYEATRNRGFGREVKMRIMLGTFALSAGYYDAWYAKALRARRLVAADFEKAFEKVDLIVAPTSPVLSIGIGEKIDDPLAMYMCDSLTTPASLAGLPALSVPCALSSSNGSSKESLPIGLQIMGPPLEDALVLRAGRAVELSRLDEIVSPLARDMEKI